MAEEKKVETVNPAWNQYYLGPEDGNCLYDIYDQLKPEMFLKPAVDVLKTKLSGFIGNKFVVKRGANEREREETQLTEEVTVDYFEGTKFVGLLFAAGFSAPCKIAMDSIRNFYSDINLEER